MSPVEKRKTPSSVARVSAAGRHAPPAVGTDTGRTGAKSAPQTSTASRAEQVLLDHFAPSAVIVRSDGHIVRLYGAMERYITLPKGDATLDVVMLARDPLKSTVRVALHEAVRRNRQAVQETPGLGRNRARATVRVTAKPLNQRRRTDRLWLILFEEAVSPTRALASTASATQPNLVRRLEAELRVTKEGQQGLVEQLQRSNEELKTANEEVVSTNEELQIANEELTTSKEELQSMNEALGTVNAQLQDRVHELINVNNDLSNLLVSTDIATVFLDNELRIRRFTTAASQMFNLHRSDAGRPISHFATNLIAVDLAQDASTVLRTLTAVEREVDTQDGRHYVLRVLPYRTEARAVRGVVLTLVDVTSLKRTERELGTARERTIQDLRRMTRLHELGGQLWARSDLKSMLENILLAASDITAAEKGDVQLCDDAGVLSLAAHAGFPQPLLDFFAGKEARTDSACGVAATTRQRVLVDDVSASPVFVQRPSLAIMTAAGVRAVQSTPLFDRAGGLLGVFSTYYRDAHFFDDTELRWLDLLARHAVDAIEWQRAQQQSARSQQELETRVADRTRWLTLMVEVGLAINGAAIWTEALQRALQVLCDSDQWQVGFVYLQDAKAPDLIAPVVGWASDERFRRFHDVTWRHQYLRGQSLPGRVFAERSAMWVSETDELQRLMPNRARAASAATLRAVVAVPIVVAGDTVGVMELCSDKVHPFDDQLVTLMNNVGDQLSRVIERERATARMADLVWTEQQQLLHTLHDSLGQTLTGIGMLSTGLGHQLAADSETRRTAVQIAEQAQHALEQVRQLTRSLFPVEVDARSLMAALRNLAAATESLSKIKVGVEGRAPAGLRNGKIATELYRIAQEAVTNAVKHAHARTITIRFDHEPGMSCLRIADDGVGIQPGIGIRSDAPSDGMGLQIMRYRATSIGGSLSIERGAAAGTVVSCTILPPPGQQD